MAKKCKRNHPQTPKNVYVRRDGFRECRTCIRLRRKRWDLVEVTCPDCDEKRVLKAGNHPGRMNPDYVCQSCAQRRNRYGGAAVRVLPEHREFWASRFTQEEIDEKWRGVSMYLDAA
jgi:predicted RNA-binding Zn-ribbon protein involved in translation (DUF1610 family)